MLEKFQLLSRFFYEMNMSNSTNHKVGVLKKYSTSGFILDVLRYTYDPYKQYGVSSANLKKRKDLIAPLEVYDDLFQLLMDLDERRITGHAAISATNEFISRYEAFADLIYQIIDRNLETRATTTLINRVCLGLIPTFNVSLAHDFTKVKGVDLIDGSWHVSRKLDGVRCLAVIRKGSVKVFSRNGKEFETLSLLKDEIVRLGIDNCVLDGEICMMKEDGSDDFQGILKEIQRKAHTIQMPKYWVFDILTLEEFDSGVGDACLSHRITRRQFDSKYISNLPQWRIETSESLVEYRDQAKSQGWEGLIARKDVGYEGDRTKNMLKIKEFFDAEYQVVDLIMGPQRIIIDGAETNEDVLSAVIIEHKGNRVQVGSGFTLEERRRYFKSPDEILGAIITTQYFEETIDQTGKHSLRFPVFKWNHGKTRSI